MQTARAAIGAMSVEAAAPVAELHSRAVGEVAVEAS